MAYHIDLSEISIAQYRDMLVNGDLLPGRLPLRNGIEEKFDRIAAAGIQDTAELSDMLKNVKKLEAFSTETGIETGYLKLLKREIGSMQPSPAKIKDFKIITADIAAKLESAGTKNTRQLYERAVSAAGRSALFAETGIEAEKILKAVKLSDLCRIKWVGHAFAELLYTAGFETARQVAEADADRLYSAVNSLNPGTKAHPVTIGMVDIVRTINAAALLDCELET